MSNTQSVNTSTSQSMGSYGHYLITDATQKVTNRPVAVIEVKSGTLLVESAKQNVENPRGLTDYPDWSSVTLDVGIHIVHFKECTVSGGTLALLHYGDR